jgi:hypothetical protein
MLHKKLAAISILFLCSTLSQAQEAKCLFDPFTAPQLSPLRAPCQSPPQELLASVSEAAPNLVSAPETKESSTSQPLDAHPLPETTTASSSSEAAPGEGTIRPVPAPRSKQPAKSIRAFSTIGIAFKANTLGAGIDIATPLSRSFNLRASANLFAFAYPFNIDGINYDAQFRFRSGQLSLDWFPEHGGFHISPGLLYFKNNLSSPASVPAGQYFELGSQGFTNSVDDPLGGTASVTYSRNIAPTLMMGFSNIIPRSGKHLSMPYEFGVAYTGTPRVNVALNGTACTYQGCFDAATNQEAQQSLTQEIIKLNNELKYLPVYPIISMGLAYRF